MSLRFSHDELWRALDASGVGVWAWNVNDDHVQWSPRVEQIFGMEPGTFGGSYGAYLEAVHPDDRAMTEARVRRALEQRERDYHIEHRIVRPDGEIRWIDARGEVEVDADGQPVRMTGTVVDVTERMDNEQREHESEERYRLFSQLATDYVYEVDATATVRAPSIVAGSLERVTGYSPDEVEARGGWLEIVHPDDRAGFRQVWATLRAGRPLVHEYRIVDAGGHDRWLRDRLQPVLDDDGKLVRLVGGVQDITERKALEQQLLHAQQMEALARLSGIVAHDFNNVLTVVSGAHDNLRQQLSGGAGDEAQATLGEIEHACRRGEELTRSLLAFGRKSGGEPRTVDLGEAVMAAAPVLQRAVGERIDVRISTTASTAVHIVPGQLQLALLNLAVNARDAMPEGGPLTVRVGKTMLTARDERRPAELAPGAWAVIDVEDCGQGIPPEVLPRVFEPFFTTKQQSKGTGLGLASCHGIVHQAGGAMRATSQPGSGTTVTIYLPIASAAAVPAPRRPLPQPTVGGREHIVVVEDDPSVRRITVQILRDHGYRVRGFVRAEEVLAMDRDTLAQIDLVVSDVRLPGSDGTALAETLRGRRPSLPVLLMSGFVEDEAQQRVIASGRYGFLQKPFTTAGLARRVREMLDRRSEGDAAAHEPA